MLSQSQIDYQGSLPFASLLDNITQYEDLFGGISPLTEPCLFWSKLGTDTDENPDCNYKKCYASPITTILQVTLFGDLHD